eukprot:GSA120T00024627001.1
MSSRIRFRARASHFCRTVDPPRYAEKVERGRTGSGPLLGGPILVAVFLFLVPSSCHVSRATMLTIHEEHESAWTGIDFPYYAYSSCSSVSLSSALPWRTSQSCRYQPLISRRGPTCQHLQSGTTSRTNCAATAFAGNNPTAPRAAAIHGQHPQSVSHKDQASSYTTSGGEMLTSKRAETSLRGATSTFWKSNAEWNNGGHSGSIEARPRRGRRRHGGRHERFRASRSSTAGAKTSQSHQHQSPAAMRISFSGTTDREKPGLEALSRQALLRRQELQRERFPFPFSVSASSLSQSAAEAAAIPPPPANEQPPLPTGAPLWRVDRCPADLGGLISPSCLDPVPSSTSSESGIGTYTTLGHDGNLSPFATIGGVAATYHEGHEEVEVGVGVRSGLSSPATGLLPRPSSPFSEDEPALFLLPPAWGSGFSSAASSTSGDSSSTQDLPVLRSPAAMTLAPALLASVHLQRIPILTNTSGNVDKNTASLV